MRHCCHPSRESLRRLQHRHLLQEFAPLLPAPQHRWSRWLPRLCACRRPCQMLGVAAAVHEWEEAKERLLVVLESCARCVCSATALGACSHALCALQPQHGYSMSNTPPPPPPAMPSPAAVFSQKPANSNLISGSRVSANLTTSRGQESWLNLHRVFRRLTPRPAADSTKCSHHALPGLQSTPGTVWRASGWTARIGRCTP